MYDVRTWSMNNYNAHIAHMHILRSKDNQAIKTCFKKRNVLLQKSCKNVAGRLFPDSFLSFKKALYESKASGLQLGFNIFR